MPIADDLGQDDNPLMENDYSFESDSQVSLFIGNIQGRHDCTAR
jgi:hypothetical protein